MGNGGYLPAIFYSCQFSEFCLFCNSVNYLPLVADRWF